jgi:hypothetical protein
MRLRGLYIAAVILAALCGVLYWSNHHPSTSDNIVKASPEAPKILTLNTADITGLAIEHKDQPTVDLSRNTSGNWQITAPQALAADQDSVSSLLSTLSSLDSDRLIDDKISDPASYGLATPPLQVAVTLKGDKTKKLLIGDQTPSGNAWYAMLAGDPRLFTIAGYSKTGLDKSTSDLRDKRLITVDFDKVSQIELTDRKNGKNQNVTLARNKDSWLILKPGPFRADAASVDDLVRSLKDAKMETVPAGDEGNSAAFKSGTPFAAAKITAASGTQELELRKFKNDYYAKSTALAGAFKVPATLGTSLDKSLDDLRNKKVFDFGYAEPNKIEIHDGSKSYFFTRSGTDWWDGAGKKVDEAAVQSLISSLRDLSASKFAESGFAAPAIEIVVTSNDNKRSEKVAIAKSKDNYVAKRENEPALYELAASSIQQLQQSAANIKAATPVAPKNK